MTGLTYVPADRYSLDTLTRAFNRAFIGYAIPLTQTPATLAAMIATNDVRLADSLVALDEDGDPVGINLLAVRPPRGWIAGMGLDPAWRGQRHGTELLGALIAQARARGLSQIQLEVLEDNLPARKLYRAFGFVEVRPLLVFNGPLNGRGQLSLPHEPFTLQEADVNDVLAHFAELHAVHPSWQRERPSLAHLAPRLLAHGRYTGEVLAAYLAYTRSNAGLAIMDAGAAASTERAATHLIHLLLELTGGVGHVVRAINVPPGDPLGAALQTLGCPIAMRQYEMRLDLPR